MPWLWVFPALVMLLSSTVATAADKSGVTPNTISLPSGPGSIEGLGESFEPTLNTGTAKYGLSLSVPPGAAGHGPAVAFSYEGGRGNGPLGFGWQVAVPFVQRQTDKGIPRYVDANNAIDDDGDGETDEVDEQDIYVTDAGEELVPVEPEADGFYFCENESAFVRYRRVRGSCSGPAATPCVDDAQCTGGASCAGMHWEGTLPDGTLQVFGASAAGRLADSEGHVFKWLLERVTDTNGNTILYSWRGFGGETNLNQRYLSAIAYGPGQPRAEGLPWDAFHFLAFQYEGRPDWFEDGRPGFLLRTGMRLRAVAVGTQGGDLPEHAKGDFNGDGATDYLNRRYDLAYEGDSHWSLLTQVTLVGADGITPLPSTRLGYTTAALPNSVSAEGATLGTDNEPIQVMDSGHVDLIDLNGDALPDLLQTDGGKHRVFFNRGENADGKKIAWEDGADVLGVGAADASSLDLANESVHLADMDGDGLADLVYNSSLGDVSYFRNDARGGWEQERAMIIDPSGFVPLSPFGRTDVKTADVDFDKRIDVIQSVATGLGADYRIWFNLGDGRYARSVTAPQECEEEDCTAGFLLSDPGVHLADVNGDRVPDAMQVRSTQLQVTAGMGRGRFAPLRAMLLPDYELDPEEIGKVRLEDINGDGLADLVLERGASGQLWYWINRGNYTFDARRVITGMPTPIGLAPEVRWADMNGNGTTDLVYADRLSEPSLVVVDIGRAIGAEPAPHMLNFIDNGIGRQFRIQYRSSTSFLMAARTAGNPWTNVSPVPLQVVARMSVSPGLDLDGEPGADEYVTDIVYRDPYYDSREKEFRGFAFVKRIDRGDQECSEPSSSLCSAPTQVTRIRFHTGAPDGIDNDADGEVDERGADANEEESLKGRVLWQENTTAAGGADAAVLDGLFAPDAAIFTRVTNDWRIRELHNPEGGTRGQATLNGGRIVFAFNQEDSVSVIERGGGPKEVLRTTRVYDDFGNAIVDRNHGAVAVGDERFTIAEYARDLGRWILDRPRRVTVTNGADERVTETRRFYDGDPFVGLDAGLVTRGNLTRESKWVTGDEFVDATRIRRDAFGNVVETLDPLGSPQSAGHRREMTFDTNLRTFVVAETIHVGGGSLPLVYQARYDAGFGLVESSRDANGNDTVYGYDRFGRLTSIVRPGDSFELPTKLFEYRLADPARGLLFVYDREGDLTVVAQPPAASSVTSLSRENAGQPGTLRKVSFVDGMGRSLASVDEAESGFVVTERVRFNSRGWVRETRQPYCVADAETAVATTSYRNCTTGVVVPAPGVVSLDYDAIGREVRRSNSADAFGAGSSVRKQYAPLARTLIDELGHPLRYRTDGLPPLRKGVERVTEVHEVNGPETYVTRFEYNAADNLMRIVDAQGNVTILERDGLQRALLQRDPNRGDLIQRFDAASNLIESVDAKDQRISYTYDGVNRVTSETYRLGESRPHPNTANVQYRYDTASGPVDRGDGTTVVPENTRGFLVSAIDGSGEEHISYDARGRVGVIVKRIPDPETELLVSYATQQQFDAMDRVRALVLPDGDRILYEFNARGLVERIRGGSGTVIDNIDYTASGQIDRREYANGVVTTHGYDPRRRLVELYTFKAGSGVEGELIHYRYGFDDASNIRRIDDLRPVGAVPPGDSRRNTQIFDYDDLYRLTRAQYSAAAPGAEPTNDGAITYTYDRIGNTLSQISTVTSDSPSHLGAMAYGGGSGRFNRLGRKPGDPPGPHALTSVAGGAELYTYDPAGNITRDGVRMFTWDAKDRLVAVENDQLVAHYSYDFADRRISKRIVPKNPARDTSTSVLYVSRDFEVRQHDQPVKYVYSGETKVARVIGSLDATLARIQRLRLHRGWNLLSLAVTATNALAQIGLGSDARVEAAYRWQSATASFVSADAQSTLPAGTVLWVKVLAPLQVHVQGAYVEPSTWTVPASGGFLPAPGFFALSLDQARPAVNLRGWLFDARAQSWTVRFGNDAETALLPNGPGFVPAGAAAFFNAPAGEVVVPPSPRRTHYYHYDHLGSANVITDETGNRVQEVSFLPSGDPRKTLDGGEPGSTPGDDYLYTGKERDAETGLHYFDARFLAAGRFTSVDPIVAFPSGPALNPQKLNPYAYALNNPIALRDPNGREADPPLPGKEAPNAVRAELARIVAPGKGKEFTYIAQADDGTGFVITEADLQSASNEMRRGGISIRTGTADELGLPAGAGAEYHKETRSLHTTLTNIRDINANTLLVHEVVHHIVAQRTGNASSSLGKLTTLQGEMAAYTIGAIYARLQGDNGGQEYDAIHAAAYRVADFMLKGKSAIAGDSLQKAQRDLSEAIRKDPIYKDKVEAEERQRYETSGP